MIFRHLLNMRSHPTWVRGLKLGIAMLLLGMYESHPTWVRGLKQYDSQEPYAVKRRTLRGCVD